ncbi:uncharacterized protein LOC110465067 [Mizuhopecten yessoensis]|uniref:Uncharacterized protein n=1 Tax=Mizuhopecten yessoensis TaxID=6573 RepID=A0A210PSE6_MIZYE|nr:uncharacterized protein LOC110465067 [Mizuhopecten yessoensis]XP_021376320.1 uncharacterized protein LOC110465067 [Mizuhopecten yessoensis]OWF39415.1 hypothetical protein KP79_PYT22957 [Mizuhopecten yessoensis]
MRTRYTFLILTLTIYHLSHLTGEAFVLPDPSSDTESTSLDRLSQLQQTRSILLKLLQQINTYAHGPPDVYVDTSILVRGDNSLDKGDTQYEDRGGTGLRSEKRDMGIMPPWRELCRLAGLRNCRGYNS